jgi:hypothetical protein
MKIGINDDSKESAALLFECLVYDRLITPMLDAQMCPNFLRSYLLSTNCTYSDLEKTLSVGVKDLDQRQIATNLHRNLTFMAQKKNYRPAIDKLTARKVFVPAVDPDHVPQLFASHRFIVISTEYSNVQSFKEWLQTPGLSSIDRYTVLLQILVALQVMALAKLRHNDLHLQNILIRLAPQVLTYIIEGIDRPITFRTTYIALLFDFDRATCEPLGVNKLMSRKYQAFEDKRDLVCFYKNIIHNINQKRISADVLDDLNAVFQARPFTDSEIEWWSKGHNIGQAIEPSLLGGIKRMSQILEQQVGVEADPFGPAANVYYATSKMFLPNGLLNRSSPDRLMLNKCSEDLRRCKEEAEHLKAIGSEESLPHKKRRQASGFAAGFASSFASSFAAGEDVRPGKDPITPRRRLIAMQDVEATPRRGTSVRASEARTQEVQQHTPITRLIAMQVEPTRPGTSVRASEALTQDVQNITPFGTKKMISPRYTGPPVRLMSPLGNSRGDRLIP